ncbi:hypothetical protein [Mycolicibacterium chlorophenolicum]|uniref:HTH merR-type domain-containing protein n=1 Tax=Mycolicibacterium chlorophenolicum TaxID=37916 RepID=A0A0J6VC52_9MYCO|nr:hypothetical protein [Mycolicibacterium chlorophenolicum]KMO67108.1 hypothetical protein MCHLDSM_06357 [Mycolicibacterium chlorophenolicum]
MTIDVAETIPPQRFFKMDEVLSRIAATGIDIDSDTIDYHLYTTRKMPKPAKKVKRERYWTADQIDSFIEKL